MDLFQPPFNFMRLPEEFSSTKNSYFVILPVGYDATTSYLPGTRRGPQAVIEASINLEWYDMELDLEPYLEGIHTLNFLDIDASSPAKMHDNILKASKMVVKKDKFFVGLGGEHSVSYGFIQAHKELYKDFTVIHFDAHADVRESYGGTEFSHASVIKNVYRLGIENIIQVGIRSMDSDEKIFLDNSNIVTITGKDVYFKEKQSIEKMLSSIKHDNVYITFDVDAFDPSLIWDTGTPEPGGLNWYQALTFLKSIFESKNVIGCDVVEIRGDEPSNASTVGKLIYKIMGYKVWQKNFR
ncbi:MAG: agmatinase [Candidatus Muirbacterium halophilum]|nr:agmatinase [Candidatus Muirbacterium halophilum]MCK9474745.1 agmatinase [Candidatus Muirbacterium halophilum]